MIEAQIYSPLIEGFVGKKTPIATASIINNDLGSSSIAIVKTMN